MEYCQLTNLIIDVENKTLRGVLEKAASDRATSGGRRLSEESRQSAPEEGNEDWEQLPYLTVYLGFMERKSSKTSKEEQEEDEGEKDRPERQSPSQKAQAQKEEFGKSAAATMLILPSQAIR